MCVGAAERGGWWGHCEEHQSQAGWCCWNLLLWDCKQSLWMRTHWTRYKGTRATCWHFDFTCVSHTFIIPQCFLFFSINLFFLSQLLEFEPRSGEQVPLLLRMKRSQLALSKAIESGDTDLGISTRTASNTLNAELMHYLYRFNTNILNTDTEEIWPKLLKCLQTSCLCKSCLM